MKNILSNISSCFLLVFFVIGCGGNDTSIVIPDNVLLVSPTKNQICEQGINSVTNKSRILFEWQSAEDAQSYDLVVTDLETGEEYITYKGLYTTKKELELVHNHAYSWYVISNNKESNKTGTSPIWNFFFVGEPRDNYAPFPANIIYPEYGSILESLDGQVTLEWNGGVDPDKDILSYTLFLDEVDGMQEPPDNFKKIENTTHTIQLEKGKTYYWRIKASDGFNSSFSQVYFFSIQK